MLAGGVVLMGLGGWAVAADAGDPEALVSEGLQLRRKGRDQEALPLFKKAFDAKVTGRTSAQLGLCEQSLGLWVDAETHLTGALALTQDAWVRKNGATLHEALGRVQERLGSIELWGTPAGARIAIDGQTAGTLPLKSPIRVADGSRVVTVEADGFVKQTRTIEVKPRSALREHVALSPLPASTPPAMVQTTPNDDMPASRGVDLRRPADGGPSTGDADTRADESPPLYKRWWFWAAAGVVAAGAGVTVYALTRSKGCQAPPGGTCADF
jgi:hypothetical protein